MSEKARWIYDPFTCKHWERSDIENFKELPEDIKDSRRPLYIEELEKFFKENSDLKYSINNNEWNTVLDRWEKWSKYYVVEVLAFFLQYVVGIDFMQYVEEPYKYSFWQQCVYLEGEEPEIEE